MTLVMAGGMVGRSEESEASEVSAGSMPRRLLQGISPRLKLRD
jgi:hypothetical protein